MLTEDELARALHDQTEEETLPADDIVARSMTRGRSIRRRRTALRVAAISCFAAVTILGAGAVVDNRYGSHQHLNAEPISPAGPSTTSTDRGHRAAARDVVERTLARAPLPPGTRRASAEEAAGKVAQVHPADQNLIDRHATYVVPLGGQQAFDWFKAHTPPGLKPSGTSTASGPGSPTITGVYFAGPSTSSYTSLAEDVAVYPADTKHAIVRIDGLAVWLLARTPAEQAPVNATAVQVVRVARAGAVPRHSTLTGAAVQQLARLINEQPTLTGGITNCPNDWGTYDTLHFTGATPDPVYRVHASGCVSIAVTTDGVAQPELDGAVAVDRVIVSLLPHQK